MNRKTATVRYIALEEHFSIPELAEQWPSAWGQGEIVFSRSSAADVARRPPEFTEYRLADMEAAGIGVQVLSRTVPGVQADLARRPRGTMPDRRTTVWPGWWPSIRTA